MLFERIERLDVFKDELVLDDDVEHDQTWAIRRKVNTILIVLILAEK